MKNISFLSENIQFLEVKFSLYLNSPVFVMRNVSVTLATSLMFNNWAQYDCLLYVVSVLPMFCYY